MTIKQFPIESREHWLELRHQDVTASAAGSLLGIHEYQTALGLWSLKTGRVKEDVEETPAMLRGLLLEPVALKLLRMNQPQWQQIEWNGEPGELSGYYFRDVEHRIGATPDIFAHDEKGRLGIIQVKTVDQYTFKRKWFDNGEDGQGEMRPPLWAAVQAIVEAHLTGAEWCAVSPLVIGSGLDQHVIDVPIHAGVIERLQNAVADFWRRVAENDPPDPDYGRDGKIIAELYSEALDDDVDLSGDNELPALLEEGDQLKAGKAAAEKRLKEIGATIRHKLKGHTIGMLRDWIVTDKLIHRAAYSVAETDYRQMRFKRRKGS